ncbi:MAG: DNA polymerase III subunit beta [Chlorobiaceae bacterium]|jgi:DNA polymerase III subunit beta|nr:DNA polymerase III subunit beta [Chlorobiaceae bacterium]NTV17397.1 DNA polymerase III subunit beta [Chlorobiaceae bacterium]
MKLTSSIRQLQDAISKVAQAIPAKTIDARFENVHLSIESDTLVLFATDGELSITVKSEVESSDTGNIGIKAKTLQDFLRSMYDTPVTFVIERQEISDHGTVHITTDKGKYKIPCQFESRHEKHEKTYDISLEFETEELLDLIQKTIFACSVDGMRPAMMGVLFELEGSVITAVSTDGHRLVRCRKSSSSDISEKQKIVIPARVLSILQKLAQNESITMSIDSDRRFVRFVIGNIVLDASLIIEPYPNYDAVIPVEHDKHLIIERSMIYDSVRRVGRFSSIGDVKMVIEGQLLKVMAENTNEGEAAQEELPCIYNGEDITIGFNSRFIEAALAHLDDAEIRIELKSPTTAVIFKPHKQEEDDKLIILVMPVRINN